MIGCEDRTTRSPVAATVVGGDRFALWCGRSGRRHVFSRVEPGTEAADLDGAVVVVAVRAADGAMRPLWIGEGGEAPLDRDLGGREVHAHWLAETRSARAGVIGDLAPCAGPVLVGSAAMGGPRRERAATLPRAA